MKKVDSVKALFLAVTVICLFVMQYSYTTFKINEEQYISENVIALEDSDLKQNIITGNEAIDFDYEIAELVIAEGVSQEEIDKALLEARRSEVVYEGMTLGELSDKLDRNLSGKLANQGITFATYATDLGVDPYLAVAIVLHETGCKWSCSNAVNNYNNVGGMMGNGGLLHFDTLDEGIEAYMNNLYNNYVSRGLTTADSMSSKYAASDTWASKVNAYINEIKAS